ncbi:beta-glucuronidase [Paenibacillus vulneris]|uniref:beta-galactosidase n=1 Tax=Paenibacillus vulneris TaxID=1133364 RepID=A0ABW3UYK5_9BACL
MIGSLPQPISLHGVWRFQLDENNVGIQETWYNRHSFAHTILLPGTLQAQGFGHKISADTPFVDGLHDRLWFLREEYKEFTEKDHTKVPFLSQPVRHYIGAAWYQTDIDIPPEWEHKRVELHLERARWKTSVWIDDQSFGDYDSLCAEHIYDLGILRKGKHVLTIRVDNSMIYPYRPDAHAVSDSVGNTWNGIVGTMELVPKSLTGFDDISVYPDYSTKSALVKIHITNQSGSRHHGAIVIKKTINLNCSDNDKYPTISDNETFHADIDHEGGIIEYTVQLGENASLWDEFNPALHQLDITLTDRQSGEIVDTKSITFGLRNITTQGRNFVLNGRNISFRGTHDAGCFPLTGSPSTDVEEWRRIMSICKQWGMNHIRYHSWCPPEAAFVAADEAGIYLQIETGMWNYFIPGGVIEQQLHVETDRIIKAYGNHASFLLLSSGNEPHGNYKPCVRSWVAKYRKLDNRRLYCAQSGWFWPRDGEPVDGTDYYYTCSRGEGRMRGIHGWFGRDYSKYLEDMEVPFLSHEVGQYCAYPDFSIIPKFTGYLRAGNYDIFKHSLEKHNMLHKNADFVQASGILQAAAYKEEVEANLRTFGYSGFSLLDLHDYLGQGSALVGLLDAFWEPKPYINPDQFRRFCAPVVPLARLNKLVYTASDTLCADLEIACFAEEDLLGETIYWKITDESGKVFINGSFDNQDIRTGRNSFIGTIETDLGGLPAPSAYKLVIGVENTAIENDWKFWVYPAKSDFSTFDSVHVTKSFSEAVRLLKNGEKVLFLPAAESLDYHCPPLSILPPFWNTQMGPKWSRSLGLWCDTAHPALAEFPTSCGMEWQWAEIVDNARGINIEALPDEVEPFIWPIDDWNRNYKLALAFECNLYNGKLVVCSANLVKDLDQRPAARQLLYSILKYMDSTDFQPKVKVTKKQLQSFLFDTAVMKRLNTTVKLVEEEPSDSRDIKVDLTAPDTSIDRILDGDPNTYWLAGGPYGGKYPFVLEFEVDRPVSVRGIHVMPRQNHRDAEGAVRRYEVYASLDGNEWIHAASGEFSASFDLKRVYFDSSMMLRKLRLKLMEGFGAEDVFYWIRDNGFRSTRAPYQDECASLAEVSFICDESSESIHSDNIKIQYKQVGTASEEIY